MAATALLRNAASTRKKVQQQEDALVAFEWQNSAQTYEQFLEYSNYLNTRQQSASDPSQALTYAKTLVSARRSYTSNELQRQQMAIMEGRGTTQSKMESVVELFNQASENGDYNLAQNLMSQYDALSIKLQNEQEAAMKSYEASLKSSSAVASKITNDLINDLTKGVDDVTLPNGQTVTPLAVIADDLKQTGGDTNSWQAAQDTLEALRGVIIDQYQTATTQEAVDKLEEKYGKGLANLDEEITFKAPGVSGGLSLQQLTNVMANEELNNPLFGLEATYNPATGKNEFKLKENAVSELDYVRQFDENGNEYFAPVQVRSDQDKLFFGQSDQGRGTGTQITDTGEVIGSGQKSGNINLGTQQVARDESQTIENRLKELGYTVRQDGTTLKVKLPNENVERQATIQPDGSIRLFGDDGQLLEVGVVDRNLGTDLSPQVFKAGQIRAVAPDEISDFGKTSAFGGKLSQASAQGERYLRDITGESPVASVLPSNRNLNIANNFSGTGSAVTSNLLQAAGTQRQEIQIQKQKQQMLQAQTAAAAALEASRTPNLNQVPVQQLASSGVLRRQLSVAAPVAAPRVYVAPPAPTQKITNVSNYQAPQRISNVGVAPSQPRVVVR